MPANGPAQPAPPLTEVDAPCYGWRYVKRIGPDGNEHLDQVPLTLEDVLHPQENDVIPENNVHEEERGKLAWWFRSRQDRLRNPLVTSDCIINWGVPGLGNHSPDGAVFEGLLTRPEEPFGTFYVKRHGARCLLALELVSPDTRKNDMVEKLREYHQAGVPLYIVVDQQRPGGPRELLPFRYTATGYDLVPLDDQGRVLLDPLGLLLGLVDNRLSCWDAATGQRLGDYTEEVQAREKTEQHLEEVKQDYEQQVLARQAAERQLQGLREYLQRLGLPLPEQPIIVYAHTATGPCGRRRRWPTGKEARTAGRQAGLRRAAVLNLPGKAGWDSRFRRTQLEVRCRAKAHSCGASTWRTGVFFTGKSTLSARGAVGGQGVRNGYSPAGGCRQRVGYRPPVA